MDGKKGFTLPEILIGIGIATLLLGLTTFSLTGASRRASLAVSTDTLVSDISRQRLRSMLADGGTENHGIFFEEARYVLFAGSTYIPEDPNNFIVALDPNVQIQNIEFPNDQIIFAKGSGEIAAFVDGVNTLTVTDSVTGEAKTLTINRFGSIVSIN